MMGFDIRIASMLGHSPNHRWLPDVCTARILLVFSNSNFYRCIRCVDELAFDFLVGATRRAAR